MANGNQEAQDQKRNPALNTVAPDLPAINENATAPAAKHVVNSDDDDYDDDADWRLEMSENTGKWVFE